MNTFSPSQKPDVSYADLFFYGGDQDIFEVTIFEPAVLQSALPESLIHSIWRHQRFDQTGLTTCTGEKLSIHKTGRHNLDSGPDFIDASVSINGVCWHGDIEIHRTSKEWFTHKHHLNTRYNSTILHVSLFEDDVTGALAREDGSLIPELVLSALLKNSLRSLLHAHRTQAAQTLPCADSLSHLKPANLSPWLKQLGKTRLLRKRQLVERAFLSDPNLENILYQLLFTGLGYAKNCEAMLALTHRIPLDTARTLTDPLDLEALYLGVSGLLPAADNATKNAALQDVTTINYLKRVFNRFQLLQERLNIPCMSPNAWQFFRLRPSNFPTLRIAQAASLFKPGSLLQADGPGVLSDVLSTNDGNRTIAAIGRLLLSGPSPFWTTHYRFRKSIASRSATIGKARINKILLNAIFPIMLVYAEHKSDPALEQAIFDLLEVIKPEKDTVTNQFSELKLNAGDACISQGLHELHEFLCKKGKCLSCNIGMSIVNKDLGKVG